MKTKLFMLILLVIFICGCAGTGKYKPAANLAPLKVSFADSAWNGKAVPAGQQCSLFGGQGSTPALIVENVPKGVNAIILEFNDRDFGPLSFGGGHGQVGFWITPGAKVTLPPVPGETTNLPKGAFIESASRSTGKYATKGYLPPCSGGRGNRYFVDVKAVYKAKASGEESKLLGEGHIELGVY